MSTPPSLSVLLVQDCNVATLDNRRAAAMESIMNDQCMMSSLQGLFTRCMVYIDISCHLNECGFGYGEDARCVPCRSSRFKEDRSLQKCKPCLDCGLINRFQKGNCSTTSNAVCGDCLPGVYVFHILLQAALLFVYLNASLRTTGLLLSAPLSICAASRFDTRGVLRNKMSIVSENIAGS
ncbi:hypothetical protein PAMA_020684 [Pampus argenteus]